MPNDKALSESVVDSEETYDNDFNVADEMIQALIDANIDPDKLIKTARYKQSVAEHHRLKLGYFPKIKDIVGCKSLPTQERIDRIAAEKLAVWMYEAGESTRIMSDRGLFHQARPKSKSAWKFLYMELKRRECVVDEFYRRRYKNEIHTLRMQNEALRQYIGRYSSDRKYPEPRDLEEAVSKYFEQCLKKKPQQSYTIPDMLLFLRITKAQWKGFLKNGPHDYQVIAEMAMLKIEGQRNRQLLTGKGQMSGHIADLNHNFDWDDRSSKKNSDQPQQVITNNILIQGAPPEPKNIEEWADWYKTSVTDKKPKALHEGSSGQLDLSNMNEAVDVEFLK